MGSYISINYYKSYSTEHYQKCDSCYLWNYKRGLHYGYPICCIESFSSKLGGIPFNDTQLTVSKYRFIPCRFHSILIKNGKIKIEELIESTRKESIPFSDFDIIHNNKIERLI